MMINIQYIIKISLIYFQIFYFCLKHQQKQRINETIKINVMKYMPKINEVPSLSEGPCVWELHVLSSQHFLEEHSSSVSHGSLHGLPQYIYELLREKSVLGV